MVCRAPPSCYLAFLWQPRSKSILSRVVSWLCGLSRSAWQRAAACAGSSVYPSDDAVTEGRCAAN